MSPKYYRSSNYGKQFKAYYIAVRMAKHSFEFKKIKTKRIHSFFLILG